MSLLNDHSPTQPASCLQSPAWALQAPDFTIPALYYSELRQGQCGYKEQTPHLDGITATAVPQAPEKLYEH